MTTYRVETLKAEHEDGTQEWVTAARWQNPSEQPRMIHGPASGISLEEAEYTVRMINASSGVSGGMARIVAESGPSGSWVGSRGWAIEQLQKGFIVTDRSGVSWRYIVDEDHFGPSLYYFYPLDNSGARGLLELPASLGDGWHSPRRPAC